MKQGKKPKVAQCNFIRSQGYDPEKWLVCKDTPNEMTIQNRSSGNTRVLVKGAF